MQEVLCSVAPKFLVSPRCGCDSVMSAQITSKHQSSSRKRLVNHSVIRSIHPERKRERKKDPVGTLDDKRGKLLDAAFSCILTSFQLAKHIAALLISVSFSPPFENRINEILHSVFKTM